MMGVKPHKSKTCDKSLSVVRIKSIAIGIWGELGNFVGNMVCLNIVRPGRPGCCRRMVRLRPWVEDTGRDGGRELF